MPQPTTAEKPALVVMPGQDIDPWVQRVDNASLQVAFDSGDNGFLRLTNEQALDLAQQLLEVIHRR